MAKRRVVAFLGSPRPGGNTDTLAECVLEGAREAGCLTESFALRALEVHPCTGCGSCWKKGKPCIFPDDGALLYDAMAASDVFLFVTPVYWYGPTAIMKAFIDRLVVFNRPEGRPLVKGKAALVVSAWEERGMKAAEPMVRLFELSFEYLELRHAGSLLLDGLGTEGGGGGEPRRPGERAGAGTLPFMRVLLVNANRMKPAIAPIGLDYLADSLHAAGHQPVLLDLCFSEDPGSDIASALASPPEVIGISVRNIDDCYFASGQFFLPGVRAVVQELRGGSEAPIVLGGVGLSVMPEAVLEFCGADFAIAGDGEEPFVQLLGALRDRIDPCRVPGLLWQGEAGLCRNPAQEMPLERLPVRTRSFLDNRRYFAEGGQAGFETKRGCPMGCVYCADPVAKGRRSRLLPPGMVVEELRALLSQGIDHFHSCDCEMNLPLSHAQDVCRAIISAGLAGRIRWYAYCSVSPFDGDTARLFAEAGCAGIDFGADSGSKEMLGRLGRHYGPEALGETARACRAAGIPFMYDLLLGAPGETRESVRRTLEVVDRASPDCVGLSLGVRLYAGTPLAAEVRGMGDMGSNPALCGAKIDNESFLRPLFYVSPDLGPAPVDFLSELVGKDERYFLPSGPDKERDYNYNDNDCLVRALAGGARGAYWDILRRMRGSP